MLITVVIAALLFALVVAVQRVIAARRELRAALLQVGDALAASGDAESIVRLLLETARHVTDSDRGDWWFDRGPAVDRVMTTDDDAPARHRLSRGEGVVGIAIESDELATDDGELAVPVRVRNRLYGVLALERSGTFGADAIADVTRLVGQATAAIERDRANDEARRLSLTDGMTGLWNRRQFELRAAQELERAGRFGERFAVVLIDLDNFKAINDTHGHLVGDEVLIEASQRLIAATREVDTIARYGGEEFVLLLPQTDPDGARNVAEKVRAELAEKPVETDAGPLAVTLSAGVASHPDNGTTVDALLRAADAALYSAKAAGKNRVVPADAHHTGAAPA
jgi:two-component system cell cycle response regulator